jgi:hypothetical protein
MMASSRKIPPVTGYGLSMLGLVAISNVIDGRDVLSSEIDVLRMDVQYSTGAAESLVPATKVHGANAVLTKHRGTHDARLDRDIEIGFVENLERVLGQDASNGDKLGMPGAIKGAVRLVHATTDDLAVFDEDTADRGFVALQGKLSL